MRKAWLANLVSVSGAFPDAAPPTPGRPPRPPRPPSAGPAPGCRGGTARCGAAALGAHRRGGAPVPTVWGSPGGRPAKGRGGSLGWGVFLLKICAAGPSSVDQPALPFSLPGLQCFLHPRALNVSLKRGTETHPVFTDRGPPQLGAHLLNSVKIRVASKWRFNGINYYL